MSNRCSPIQRNQRFIINSKHFDKTFKSFSNKLIYTSVEYV